jgi:hypothetical protein
MKQLYKHNDKWYIIHREISVSTFTDKKGIIHVDAIRECRDFLPFVDHVLRDKEKFMFVETIQEAEIVEEELEIQ